MDFDSSIENNDYYRTYIANPERNEDTAKRYKRILKKLCKATGCTIDEIITTCIDEQTIVTTIPLEPDKNGHSRHKEIKFNINNKDASINKYFKQYEEYCRKRNNKEITIQGETDSLRAFLSEFGVILPKRKKYEDDSSNWYLPTKEDFNFISQDLSLVHAALLNFLTSTGMRIQDACSLTIGDFMSSTSEYHDFVDVEDFIDHADEDMIGTWVFEPHKTIRHKTKCITFNSAYSSNLILQHLRHVKNEYLPYKNNKNKRENKKLKNNKKSTNIKINKKYPLFGSRRHEFKEPIPPKAVGGEWGRKSKKFQRWKIKQIEQKIKDGELSHDDYEDELAKIPKFHPHICRKFFSTIVSNNCGDIRVCALLEGHSDGLPNDKYYIKKTVKDIRDIYIKNIHDELSLNHVETKIISDKETERLNAEMESLRNENKDLKNQVKEMSETHQEEVAQLNIEMGDLRKEMKQNIEVLEAYKEARNLNAKMKNIIVNPELDLAIKKYYADHHDLGGRYLNSEEQALCKLAYDEAIKEDDFEPTEKNIETLFEIVEVRCNMNPDLLNKTIRIIRGVPDEALENIIDEISNWIIIQPKLLKMAGGNPIRIQTVVQRYVLSNPEIEDKIPNINDKDKNKIIEHIMIECVKFNAQNN